VFSTERKKSNDGAKKTYELKGEKRRGHTDIGEFTQGGEWVKNDLGVVNSWR